MNATHWSPWVFSAFLAGCVTHARPAPTPVAAKRALPAHAAPAASEGSPAPRVTDARAAEEAAIVDLVNTMRARGGRCPSKTYPPSKPLRVQPTLAKVARAHAADMLNQGYFAHKSQDGRSPFQRMRDAGYRFGAAENIAAGNTTAARTFAQWVKSDGHCRNMMNPRFTHIGVGVAARPKTKLRHVWVQTFGVEPPG